MSNYPFIKMYTCSDNVTNQDYIDIDYTTANFFYLPAINAITHSSTDNPNVNVFVSNVTKTTARLNFSSKFTGTVKYTIISIR